MIRRKQPRAREQSSAEPTLPPCAPGRVCAVWLPIRTRSAANERGSTKWRGARDAKIRGKTALIARAFFAKHRVRVPCTVVMTRFSPSELDSDNAQSAMKRCRDGIADALGIDDRDERVVWVVAQHKCRVSGVLIEVYEPGACAETLIALGDDWIRRNAHALDIVLPLLRNASKTRA